MLVNCGMTAACMACVFIGCLKSAPEESLQAEDGRFYLYAVPPGAASRTETDPSDLTVEWSTDDRLSVLARAEGDDSWTPYEFVREDKMDRFYCEAFTPEPDTGYELCIQYPYDRDLSSADDNHAGNSGLHIGELVTGFQIGEKSAFHTDMPMYAHVDVNSSEKAEILMHHAAAMFEIALNNCTEKEISVTGLDLSTDTGQMISGSFSISFSSGELVPLADNRTSVSATVEDCRLPAGETCFFYISVAPFSLAHDDSFTLKVSTGDSGILEFPCTIPEEGCEIRAGSMNRISRNIGEIYYREVTSEPSDWTGDYLITYTASDAVNVLDGYSQTYGTSSTDLSGKMTDNGIRADDADSFKAEIRKFGDGYSILVTGIGYIGYAGSGNSLSRNQSGSPDSSTDIWHLSHDSGVSPANAPERSLKWNTSSPRFACYLEKATNCKHVTLYRRSSDASAPSPDPGPDDPDPTPGSGANTNGWLRNLEIPAAETSLGEDEPYSTSVNESYSGAIAYVCNTDNPDQLIVTHTFTESGKRYRNYTLLFDKNKKAALWVAFGMHKNVWEGDSGRNDSWKDDPAIPSSWQSPGCRSPYSRGHQIASGDRQVNVTANKQTFYHSNQTPQWQDGFNGGIWNTLENAIQDNAPSGRDTMYVVTGPVFEDGKTIVDRDGNTVPLPSAYWKCVMLCSFDNTGNITDAKGTGYYFPGNKALNGSFGQYSCTIDEIEEICGFDLFANIPDELQNAAENTKTDFLSR